MQDFVKRQADFDKSFNCMQLGIKVFIGFVAMMVIAQMIAYVYLGNALLTGAIKLPAIRIEQVK